MDSHRIILLTEFLRLSGTLRPAKRLFTGDPIDNIRTAPTRDHGLIVKLTRMVVLGELDFISDADLSWLLKSDSMADLVEFRIPHLIETHNKLFPKE